MGDFFDIFPVHFITEAIISHKFGNAREVLLVQRGILCYNGGERGDTMVIGIIGAGASGMAAALSAAKNADVQVLLFERQARVGRKLQATGNGRCNLTNLHADMTGYHGDTPEFAKNALMRFDVQDTLRWFGEMGLYTVSEQSGRVYPYSDQANSVVDVLRFALEKDNISLHTGFEVSKVRKTDEGFQIEGNGEVHTCDKLIIACGGLAGTKLGGSMSGYQLLRSFGHRVTKLRPALVQLKSSWNCCNALKGVRANCHAAIYHNGILWSESTGELQFTEYGLSGPVIFEISRDVCREKGEWLCKLDLLPELLGDALLSLLQCRRSTKLSTDELFTGILHNRLGRVVAQNAGIRSGGQIADLRDDELERAAETAKALEISLTEPLGMEHAQVTAGGVCTEEFDDRTLESKLVPGLYACGEVLDIDGDCGGFNLQWAWSSGRLAGECAGGNA
jgi:predicted Rossmann fold flavoprotein